MMLENKAPRPSTWSSPSGRRGSTGSSSRARPGSVVPTVRRGRLVPVRVCDRSRWRSRCRRGSSQRRRRRWRWRERRAPGHLLPFGWEKASPRSSNPASPRWGSRRRHLLAPCAACVHCGRFAADRPVRSSRSRSHRGALDWPCIATPSPLPSRCHALGGPTARGLSSRRTSKPRSDIRVAADDLLTSKIERGRKARVELHGNWMLEIASADSAGRYRDQQAERRRQFDRRAHHVACNAAQRAVRVSAGGADDERECRDRRVRRAAPRQRLSRPRSRRRRSRRRREMLWAADLTGDRHVGGQALPRRGHRLLLAPGRRLGDGRAHARRARGGRARDGRLAAQARRRSHGFV
jgi:hypothetical protein